MSSAVCVFCGSQNGFAPAYATAAQKLGAGLAQNGWPLVYGGGSVGLMGLVARDVLANQGNVIGVITQVLMAEEVGLAEATELIVTETMQERKALMIARAAAFVILPGGFGTLDELFEILALKQLGYLAKPIILINLKGFYDPLLKLLEHIATQGFLYPKHLELFQSVASVEEALEELTRVLGTF